jgi:methionyl-tRNA synthetase
MDKFYVTTPIYYVNDKPHVGHAYTTVVADVFARYQRGVLGDDKVFFLTGTDEHGAKVAQAAEDAKVGPQAFVDNISGEYEKVWKKLNISQDYFIRTTDPKHKEVVQDVLQKLYDKGLIYKANYKGLYCVGCEKYLTPSETESGHCLLHPKTDLKNQEEENYFFKLSELAPKVLAALEGGKYQVLPRERYEEILSRIKAGVEDISISRTGVKWGVPVPWDEAHTVYVWVDALLNYYSATKIAGKEDFWAPDLQLLAKDILWFHALIWEAILIALDMELPRDLFVHGFFTIDGQKMSKSSGNVMDPVELAETYGVDGLRYLLLTSFAFGNDGDISLTKFDTKYNADLANGLGNLVSRVAKLAENFDLNSLAKLETGDLDNKFGEAMTKYRPDEALGVIWSEIGILDKSLDTDEPWKMEEEALNSALKGYIPRLQWVAEKLIPFMPETAEKVIQVFSGDKVVKPESLFQRL